MKIWRERPVNHEAESDNPRGWDKMRGDLLCRFESEEFECAHPTRYCHMLTRRGEVKNENSGQNDPYRYLPPLLDKDGPSVVVVTSKAGTASFAS